jgi:hypothetical protein
MVQKKIISELVDDGFFPTWDEEPLADAGAELGLTAAQIKAKLMTRRSKQDAELRSIEVAEAQNKIKQEKRLQLHKRFPKIIE